MKIALAIEALIAQRSPRRLAGFTPNRDWDDIGAMTKPRIYGMSFAGVYRLYIAKAERKGRTKAEVDEALRWLLGVSQEDLDGHIAAMTTFEDLFAAQAPTLNPNRWLITGVVCGVRVEAIEEPLMREIRYMDKLIDELAKGKAMAKVLRA